MIVPKGWAVNPRYVPGKACPRCGAPLRRLAEPMTVSTRGRLDAGSQEVVQVRGDGFKATRSVTGYRSTVTAQCSGCGRLVTAAGAEDRDFVKLGAPPGYFVRDVPDTPETRAEAIRQCIETARGGGRERPADRGTTVAPRVPEQGALFGANGQVAP